MKPVVQNIFRQTPGRPLSWPVFVLGFAATTTQIIFLRELVVVFSGNELSLAVVLASWLLWTSLGSGFLDKFSRKPTRPAISLGIVQISLSAVLPASLLFIRASLILFHRLPGEIPGLLPIFWISLLATGPFCLLSGWAFALSGRLLSRFERSAARSVGKVYLVEAVGAATGGFLVSLFLLQIWNSAEILDFAALLEFASGVLLLTLPVRKPLRAGISFSLVALFTVLAALGTPVLQKRSLQIRWKNQTVLTSRNTFYENLTLTRLGEQTNFFQNGLLAFSVPDPLGAEESTQFALLEHPAPRTVLLIGGGLGEQLEKILAHPTVQRVDYVELDPAVVTLGEKYLHRARALLQNSKIRVHFADARLYLRKTKNRYDVIILNAPPPATAQLNRLYTREFFVLAAAHLNKGGLLSFALPSSENFINRDLAQLLRTFRQTLRSVFPNVLLLPGQKAHFFASLSPGLLTNDYRTLVSRLRKRGVQNLFVSVYYLPFRLSPERLASFRKQLKKGLTPRLLNTDFHPLGYYYNALVWSTYFYTGTRNVLRRLAQLPPVFFFFVFGIFYFLLFVWIFLKNGRTRAQVGLSIFTIGFTEIALEVLLILGFQLIYGYAYYWLSLIVTLFMAGLALGATLGVRQKRSSKQTFQLLRWIQFGVAVLPLILIGFFTLLHGKNFSLLFIYSGFVLLTLLSGFLGGFQFPLGNDLFWGKNAKATFWGTLYSLDLLGSVLGALLVAALALPLLGLIQTLLLLSLMNTLAWTALLLQNDTA